MIYLILCHTIIHLIIRLILISQEFQVREIFSILFPKISHVNVSKFRSFLKKTAAFVSFLPFHHFHLTGRHRILASESNWENPVQALADAKKCSEVR